MFATILRWNTTTVDPDDDFKQVAGQVLVVTRLGPGGVCHVGYVDGRANPNANELARQIADDNARTFRCGKDKPLVLGAKGKGFAGPTAAARTPNHASLSAVMPGLVPGIPALFRRPRKTWMAGT